MVKSLANSKAWIIFVTMLYMITACGFDDPGLSQLSGADEECKVENNENSSGVEESEKTPTNENVVAKESPDFLKGLKVQARDLSLQSNSEDKESEDGNNEDSSCKSNEDEESSSSDGNNGEETGTNNTGGSNEGTGIERIKQYCDENPEICENVKQKFRDRYQNLGN